MQPDPERAETPARRFDGRRRRLEPVKADRRERTRHRLVDEPMRFVELHHELEEAVRKELLAPKREGPVEVPDPLDEPEQAIAYLGAQPLVVQLPSSESQRSVLTVGISSMAHPQGLNRRMPVLCRVADRSPAGAWLGRTGNAPRSVELSCMPLPRASQSNVYPGGWLPIRYDERCRRQKARLSEALVDAIDVCRSRVDVTRLLVFGSFARDEISPWSDLDLAVVVDSDVRGAVAAIYERGVLGDVIGIEADDWRERLRRNPFGLTILAEAIEAYARPEA